MKTTFVNQNSENNIVEAGKRYLNSRKEDLNFFSQCTNEDDDEFRDFINNGNFDISEIREFIRLHEQLGSWFDYGLSYDYVELGTFDDQDEDYFRFQMSWGGPSDELRFYEDGTIIYVYLDWFSGVGFDVTGEVWAEWVKEWFDGAAMMDFQEKRESYDYYEKVYEMEENED